MGGGWRRKRVVLVPEVATSTTTDSGGERRWIVFIPKGRNERGGEKKGKKASGKSINPETRVRLAPNSIAV